MTSVKFSSHGLITLYRFRQSENQHFQVKHVLEDVYVEALSE